MSRDHNADEKTVGTSYAAPAVDKAFEILALMANEANGLNVTEISAKLGRSTSQIYRVILSLHRLGYLQRTEETDRYCLSLKLFEISTRFPPVQRLITFAQPLLEILSEETDQSSHLGVLSGRQLVIMAQANSPMPMHYTVKIGAGFPAMETSSGTVIAAYLSERRQTGLLADFAPSEQDDFRKRFLSILKLGYEKRNSAVTAGVINLSKPVFSGYGQPVGALTIPFLAQSRMRFEVDAVLERLLAAADELSKLLSES